MEITTRKDAFNQGNVENETELQGKVIRNMTISKRLFDRIDQSPTNTLRVIGVKPDRENPQRSILVWEKNEKFEEEFSKVLEEYRKGREGSTEVEDLKNQVEELKKLVATMANKEG